MFDKILIELVPKSLRKSSFQLECFMKHLQTGQVVAWRGFTVSCHLSKHVSCIYKDVPLQPQGEMRTWDSYSSLRTTPFSRHIRQDFCSVVYLLGRLSIICYQTTQLMFVYTIYGGLVGGWVFFYFSSTDFFFANRDTFFSVCCYVFIILQAGLCIYGLWWFIYFYIII